VRSESNRKKSVALPEQNTLKYYLRHPLTLISAKVYKLCEDENIFQKIFTRVGEIISESDYFIIKFGRAFNKK